MEHSFTVNELPLIVFTMLMQASLGLSIVISFVVLFSKTSFNTSFHIKENGIVDIMRQGTIEVELIRRIYGLAFLFSLLGIILSTLHLGDHTHAMYIVERFFNTTLPREVIFCSVFSGLSFLIMVFLRKLYVSRILLVITPIVGFLALIFMARFYGQMAQTNPAWDSVYTFMRFLGATLMLGGFLSAIFVILHSYTGGWNLLSIKLIYSTAFTVIITGILISFAYQPNFEFYLANVSNNIAHDIYHYKIQLTISNTLISLGVFLALIDYFINFVRTSSRQKPSVLTVIAFILVLIALFISRDIFYALKNTKIM